MWKPQLQKIDLTEEKVLPKQVIEARVVENFLGGRGITVYLGYHSIPTDASPRGPDNAVIFGTGILTGTIFPSAGMAVATFKSPHTNTLFTSVATGQFGVSMKQVGIDFLQILGRVKSPKYILIDEFADVTLEDAEKIWKKPVSEVDDQLRKKHGKNASIATLGLSAINQVTYAGLVVDLVHFFRRGGLGTVLASKNIKAIVITEPPQISELEGLSSEYIDQFNQLLKLSSWYKMLNSRGSFSTIFPIIENNALPTKNCSRLLQLASEKISSFKGYGEPYQCWQCAMQCQRNSYQNFSALGPNLKIVDNKKIQEAIESCDREGLDPLSTGTALASLFNIQEDRRKMLDIDLGFQWGNPNIYSLIEKIIQREGLGDQLSRGEAYLYQQTNENSPMVKNQMGGMYYYPNILGLSLATSISPYGAYNYRSNYMVFPEILGFPFKLKPGSKRGKVRTIILFERLVAVLDSLVVCTRYLPIFLQTRSVFDRFSPDLRNNFYQLLPNPLIGRLGLKMNTILPLLKSIFDSELTFQKLLAIGNRITLLERIFNTRMGMARDEDSFAIFIKKRPDFFKKQEELISEYYSRKGLTLKGMVKKKTLQKSGLLGIISI